MHRGCLSSLTKQVGQLVELYWIAIKTKSLMCIVVQSAQCALRWVSALTFVFPLEPLPANQWFVNLEDGIDQEVAEELKRRGHNVNWPITGTIFFASLFFAWNSSHSNSTIFNFYFLKQFSMFFF